MDNRRILQTSTWSGNSEEVFLAWTRNHFSNREKWASLHVSPNETSPSILRHGYKSIQLKGNIKISRKGKIFNVSLGKYSDSFERQGIGIFFQITFLKFANLWLQNLPSPPVPSIKWSCVSGVSRDRPPFWPQNTMAGVGVGFLHYTYV